MKIWDWKTKATILHCARNIVSISYEDLISIKKTSFEIMTIFHLKYFNLSKILVMSQRVWNRRLKFKICKAPKNYHLFSGWFSDVRSQNIIRALKNVWSFFRNLAGFSHSKSEKYTAKLGVPLWPIFRNHENILTILTLAKSLCDRKVPKWSRGRLAGCVATGG